MWQLAQEYPARLWDAKKGLQAVDAGLADAQRIDAALEQAQRDEPARFEAFAARIKALGGRIQALVPRVAALSNEQQGQVQELAVAIALFPPAIDHLGWATAMLWLGVALTYISGAQYLLDGRSAATTLGHRSPAAA